MIRPSLMVEYVLDRVQIRAIFFIGFGVYFDPYR